MYWDIKIKDNNMFIYKQKYTESETKGFPIVRKWLMLSEYCTSVQMVVLLMRC